MIVGRQYPVGQTTDTGAIRTAVIDIANVARHFSHGVEVMAADDISQVFGLQRNPLLFTASRIIGQTNEDAVPEINNPLAPCLPNFLSRLPASRFWGHHTDTPAWQPGSRGVEFIVVRTFFYGPGGGNRWGRFVDRIRSKQNTLLIRDQLGRRQIAPATQADRQASVSRLRSRVARTLAKSSRDVPACATKLSPTEWRAEFDRRFIPARRLEKPRFARESQHQNCALE